MTKPRRMSTAELAVLEALLPHGLTDGMRDVATCLFEALLLNDDRTGQAQPAPDWIEQLKAWADQVLMQMQHLANEKGGSAPIYFAKGVVMRLHPRDREMCAKFRGNNYDELAAEYDLTEMRVRQIVGAWQRERFLSRQQVLPGLDG